MLGGVARSTLLQSLEPRLGQRKENTGQYAVIVIHLLLTDCKRVAGGIRTRVSPILSVRNVTVGLARFCAPQPTDARVRARSRVNAAESHVGLVVTRRLKAPWAPTRAEAGSQSRWLCYLCVAGLRGGTGRSRDQEPADLLLDQGGDQVTGQIAPD